MNENQQAAYIVAMAACVTAEVAAMQAENQGRLQRGEAPAYGEADFLGLIDRYGIHHNAVVGWFR